MVWLKRLFFVALGVFSLFVLAALIVPLVVDVNKYRSVIEEAVEQQINGDLEIGEMRLSLWTGVSIAVDSASLKELSGREVFTVGKFSVDFPFWPLMTGAPHLQLKMDQPSVTVTQDKSGNLNAMNLLKKSDAPAAEAVPPPEKDTASKPIALPKAVANRIKAARLDLEVTKINLLFKSFRDDIEQRIEGLDFIWKDLSLSKSSVLTISGHTSTKLKDLVDVNGALKLVMRLTPNPAIIDDMNLDPLKELVLRLDLSDLDIQAGQAFFKKKGIPLMLETVVTMDGGQVDVSRLQFKMHTIEVNATATVTDYKSDKRRIVVSTDTQSIPLTSFADLVPLLAQYKLEGVMGLKAGATLQGAALDYNASLQVRDLSASAPQLKEPVKVQVAVEVKTDQVESLKVDLKTPTSDLNLGGAIRSFKKPVINFSLNSQRFDVDKLLGLEPVHKIVAAKEGAKAEVSPTPTATPEDPRVVEERKKKTKAEMEALEAKIHEIFANEVLRGIDFTFATQLRHVTVLGIDIKNIDILKEFKQAVGKVTVKNIDLFDGKIQSALTTDLKPKPFTYSGNAKIQALNLATAVKSVLTKFKDTLSGTLTTQLKFSGRGLADIAGQLNADGGFSIVNAQFATLDVSNMLLNTAEESLKGIYAGIPGLADKLPASVKRNHKSRYKEVSSQFSLAKNIFKAPNFKGVAHPKEGIDIEGKTELNLDSTDLNSEWMLIDRYDLAEASKVAVEVQGVRIERILLEEGQPFRVPVKIGCKMAKPCVDSSLAFKFLRDIAMKNIERKSTQVLKARAQEEIKKQSARLRQELDKQKGKGKQELDAEKKKQTEALKKDLEKQGKDLLKGFGF